MGNDGEMTGPVTPAPVTGARSVRPLTVVLAVALLVLVGVLVVPRLLDPYRPGTTHEVTVQHDGCMAGPDVRDGGHFWTPAPDPAWVGVPHGTYRLRFDVVSEGEAVLHVPNGAEARYLRRSDGAFSNLVCAIL